MFPFCFFRVAVILSIKSSISYFILSSQTISLFLVASQKIFISLHQNWNLCDRLLLLNRLRHTSSVPSILVFFSFFFVHIKSFHIIFWLRKKNQKFLWNYLGLPIYRGARARATSLENLLNPRASLPPSAIIRDPFWYDLDDLRPFGSHIPTNNLPAYLRESYLSPVKRRYLWTKHPLRPFGKFINALRIRIWIKKNKSFIFTQNFLYKILQMGFHIETKRKTEKKLINDSLSFFFLLFPYFWYETKKKQTKLQKLFRRRARAQHPLSFVHVIVTVTVWLSNTIYFFHTIFWPRNQFQHSFFLPQKKKTFFSVRFNKTIERWYKMQDEG